MVYRTVYLEGVAHATYVATNVYELVYNIAYAPLFQVYRPFHLDIWDGGTLLRSVFLTFEAPPPEPSPGISAPPPVPPVAPPLVIPDRPVIATPVVVGAAATSVVGRQAIADHIRANPLATIVAVKVPVTAGISHLTTQLPAAAITALIEAKRGVSIETQFASFSLPAGLLAAPEIARMVAGARLEVAAQLVPEAQATALLARRPAVAAPAGQVLEFTLRVADPAEKVTTVLRTFRERLWVRIPFEAARLRNIPAWKLGVYRFNEAAGRWEFQGGKVDAAAGTVAAGLSAFSRFTVMAYDRTFADIRNHWGQRDIELMASRHIAGGVGANQFAPNREITRAEFAALLLRSLGIAATPPAGATFKDVAADKWYYAEVETARRVGLVAGYADNTFRPDRKITRQELAAMVSRAMSIAGKPVTMTEAEVNTLLTRFADATGIAPWARHAVATALKAGIVKGRAATTIVPAGNGTRAESVVMLKRMLAELGEI
jgi:hypothetical protein